MHHWQRKWHLHRLIAQATRIEQPSPLSIRVRIFPHQQHIHFYRPAVSTSFLAPVSFTKAAHTNIHSFQQLLINVSHTFLVYELSVFTVQHNHKSSCINANDAYDYPSSNILHEFSKAAQLDKTHVCA